MALNTCEMWSNGIKKNSFFFSNYEKLPGAGASLASRDPGGKIKIRRAKVFAEMQRLFLAKSQIFRPKAGDLQTNKKKIRRNTKAFSGRNRKFYRFFRPKYQLLPPKKIPWGGRKKSGGHCPPAGDAPGPAASPPHHRLWFVLITVHFLTQTRLPI